MDLDQAQKKIIYVYDYIEKKDYRKYFFWLCNEW